MSGNIINCDDGLIQITTFDPHRVEISVNTDDNGDYLTDEALKIARLIDLAPEMYETLKRCIVDAEQDLTKKECLERIKELIARIED